MSTTHTKPALSTLAQKFIMALTGLALVGFVITHLLGNLTLLAPNPEVFNTYAHKLQSFGRLLTVAEIGLFAFFAVHIITGIGQVVLNKKARPQGYRMLRSKAKAKTISGGGGGEDAVARAPEAQPSNVSSRKMAISGFILLVFLIIHLKQFTWGPGISEGYVTQLNGEEARDLYRLVSEVFKNPLWVGGYVGAMLFLGLHLRHAFWSAFQSLGLIYPRISKPIHALGLLLAVVLAVGFLVIPVWLYLGIASSPGVLQ